MSRRNMVNAKDSTLEIDLDQFKLHLTLQEQSPLTFHFDTPSRRFYLSVIALVVQQMRQNNRSGSVPLKDHAQVLTLLNETVGGTAGSSEKKKLLARIYRKWKSALPDMENAPLFKVVGRKKAYDESSALVYRFDRKTQDAWANLFEHTGSGKNVRLRFSWEKAGIEPKNINIVYGNQGDTHEGRAWDRFIGSLQPDSQELKGADSEEIEALIPELERDAALTLKELLKKPGEIEKIPLKTRLELIARLAAAPGSVHAPAKPEGNKVPGRKVPDRLEPLEMSDVDAGGYGLDQHVSQILMDSVSALGSNAMLYAAPELQKGRSSSPRSDVYALGVLLYQVVVGDLSRPLDADWKAAVKDDVLREDIAACVEALPEKRLASPYELTRRLATLDERRRVLLPLSTLRKIDGPSLRHRKRRWLAYGFAMAVILALLALPAWYYQKVSRAEAAKKEAYQTNLPKIRELLEQEKYVAAYGLACETEKVIPDDPSLEQYIQDATSTFDIETMPAGARVSYRPYSDAKRPWVELGTTPIKDAVVPVGMTRFRIQKTGYAERELVRPVVPRNSLSAGFKKRTGISEALQFNLYEKNRVPEGMVPVDGCRFFVAVKGIPLRQAIVNGPFFIDRLEVTNRAYREFVSLGGYGDPKYWKEEFRKDGEAVPWTEAMKAFVDRTGRPGPATWELGNYPEGRDNYPVSGISWYEAAAYARFRGKTLPTIYHWARALFTRNDQVTPLTPWLIPQSNIEGTAVAPVGRYPGTGSSGAGDMAGNVREWCWNADEENRYCLGGCWKDPAYLINDSCVPSAWDRSEGNGVRCALYPEDAPPSEAHLKPADLRFYDPYAIPPLSKESLEALKPMLDYKKGPLHPVVESRKSGGEGWVRETVTIDATYGNERLIIYLDLPDRCKPPYKAVIYWPGANALYQPKFSRNFLWEPWDLIPKHGRAFISPIYSNCFERGGGKPFGKKKTAVQRWFDRLNDLRRTIDYLETRRDIDTRSLAFLGLSWGGLEGPKIPPYEERIKTLILVSGGFFMPMAWKKPDALVHGLTDIPVLMLNGKYDFVMPVKTHQKPLFELLGTPPEHKKHVIYDCGHLPLPRAPMMKEIFAWLDKYQGPVECDKKVVKIDSMAKIGR